MKLNYNEKEAVMQAIFGNHKSPAGFRSTYKGVTIGNYEMVKQFIVNDTNIIGDKAFPSIVLHFFPPAVGIIFIIALISALLSVTPEPM